MEAGQPDYLYKILSARNWRATEARKVVRLASEDHEFIHFSAEKQLDSIVEKYWSDVAEFAILKVDTSKLLGELVYEANPGRVNKYWHLYEGSIPFEAIAEAKIIYREPPSNGALDIVKIGDPVLRQKARTLSKEEILSPKIQKLIEDMIYTMRDAPGVGLAAPQVGQSLQIVVVEDVYSSYLTPEEREERDRREFPLHVVINPTLTIEEEETAEFFEGCLSIPLVGLVPRAKAVRVDCLNEKGKPVTLQARGWYARILQHEIDHLNGVLNIDRSIQETISTDENAEKFWR
ncbi:MAG: peptide deformylase [Simkaniaceae bacterium]|nr:peptide deformylase [Candidatus Sacchlamyda saccharinae]